MISNAATGLGNVVGLVFVAAFAPDEGERLGEVAAGSRDSVLGTAQVALQYPTPDGRAAHRVRDRSREAPRCVRRRPAGAAGGRDGRDPTARLRAGLHRAVRASRLEVAAVLDGGLATSDKAAGTDVVRSMAERAGATITEVEGSHVIMISRPDVVADVIKTAAAAVSRPVAATAG